MKSQSCRVRAGFFALAVLSLSSCSSSRNGGSHSAGTSGSGGGGGTGGHAAGAKGGATGGSEATGGTDGRGGAGAGGVKASGGSSKGGATGGFAAGGKASGGSGGSGGTGGAQARTSPGCKSASPLQSGTFSETIDETTRTWMLDVPNNYDGAQAYRLIFAWHPLGGSAAGVANDGYYGLKPLSNDSAIFVTADGLNGSNSEASGTGWWNVNGGDMKLLQALLDKINANLCIDQDRIFSTGFSFGGMMTYSVGFEFKVFRAIAPCSGKEGVIKYNANNTDPLPIIAFHGDSDTFVLTSLGRAFRDKYVARNKCGTETQPVSPSPCVQYQGCAAPTIWCEFPGGHNTWSEQPQAIWDFFAGF
jgi:predicted esterase